MPQGQKVPLLLTYVAGSNTCVQPNPLTGALSLTCVQHHGVLQQEAINRTGLHDKPLVSQCCPPTKKTFDPWLL